MKVAGIVAEFNPFHYGHEYIISKIKEDNVDLIICAMSPNFVMRGEPAIFNKFERCEIALKNGIDIVAEIPTIYTIESADIYAKRSIEILANLGVTDLYFGIENTDLGLLNEVVNSLDSDSYKNHLSIFLKDGYSFNQASKKALESINSSFSSIISSPNALLSIHYLKTIKDKNYKIAPHLIKRIDSEYYSNIDENKKIQSATALREQIENKKSSQYLSYSIQNFNVHVKKMYFELIKYRIFSMNSIELSEIQGINEGLENKIKSIKYINSYDELISNLISKRNRETKINRILMCILLNIKKNEVTNKKLEYCRILGFNSTGRAYLNKFKNENISIITSIKRNLSKDLYRELDFTKIYSIPLNESILEKEYSPIIVD